MEHEIILEMSRLLEKTGMDHVIPIVTAAAARMISFWKQP